MSELYQHRPPKLHSLGNLFNSGDVEVLVLDSDVFDAIRQNDAGMVRAGHIGAKRRKRTFAGNLMLWIVQTRQLGDFDRHDVLMHS